MAGFRDSWRSGGTGRGPYILLPRATTEVPLSVDGLATSVGADVLFRVRQSDGTVVFSVTNAGNLTFAGSGIISVDTTITGNLTVNGNTVLGNASTDTITITGVTSATGTLSVTGSTTFGNNSPTGDGRFLHNLTVDNALTVNGEATFAAVAVFAGGLHTPDDDYFSQGNNPVTPDVRQGWNTAQTVDAWYFGTADGQNTLIIAENGDRAFDFAHAAQVNPTLFIHSAVAATTQWISLTHNQTDALITVGAGNLRLDAVAGSGVVINEDSIDMDFRVESDNNANMITMDAALDSVGIGKVGDTNYALDVLTGTAGTGAGVSFVVGNIATGRSATDYGKIGFNFRTTNVGGTYNYNSNDFTAVIDFTSGDLRFQTAVSGVAGNPITFIERANFKNATEAVFNDSSNDYDFRVESDAESNMFFIDASTNVVNVQVTDAASNTEPFVLRTTATGSVGIGLYQTTSQRSLWSYTNATSTTLLDSDGTISLAANNAVRYNISSSGNHTFSGAVNNDSAVTSFTFTGAAHTAITAATEKIGVNFNFSATKTWAAGAGPLATQREFVFQAPTYVGDVAGALTITTATLLSLGGNPVDGANMTLTTSRVLSIEAASSGAGTLTNTIGLDIADQSIAAATTGFAIRVQSQTANATTTRAIEVVGTGVNNAIRLGASPNIYSSGAEVIRFADSTNGGGLSFTLTAAGDQNINTIDTGDNAIILQAQTFTSGATHGAVQINPSWATENFDHNALELLVTQSGANSTTLRGLQLTMRKLTGASVLATMTGIDLAVPTFVGTTTTATGLLIGDYSSAGGTTAFGISILSQTANATTTRAINLAGTGVNNAIRLGGSPNIYSSAAEVIRFGDSTDARTISFTLTAAGAQTIGTSAGALMLNSIVGFTASAVTLGAAATALAITTSAVTVTGDVGANTVATITGATVSGQIVILTFVDALVTITDDAGGGANTVNLSAAFTSTVNDTMTLIYNGTSWREVARAVN